MAMNWKTGTLFAAGLALGIAAGVAGVLSLNNGGAAPASASPTRAVGAPAAAKASATPVATGGPGPRCTELAPLLAKGPDGDGRESLQKAGPAVGAGDISALLLKGKEAAAGKRPRDAEILFLNACRTAQAANAGGLPAADAQYQLARHYANAAAFGAARPRELYERANRLYSASLQIYEARHGASHERTKFAREGLITVQQVTGVLPPLPTPAAVQARPAAPAPAPKVVAAAPAAPVAAPAPVAEPAPAPAPVARVAPAPAPALAPAPAPAPVAKAPPAPAPKPAPAVVPAPAPEKEQVATAPVKPAPEPTPAPAPRRTTSPSFNCAQARSTTEKLICGDEELARLDRDLGRLHQRAKEAAPDRRAFQRASDAEWQRREDTCRDRECLRNWYAERRQELSAAAAAPRPVERPAPVVRAPAPVERAEPPLRRAQREEPVEIALPPGTASGDAGTATMGSN